MRVLALESSCDETAWAVVESTDDPADLRVVVRADVVASQAAVHARWGGVVPEVAARHHVQSVLPTVRTALDEAGLGPDPLAAIDAVAVTRGPGLIGALLVAVQAGKAIAFARGLPLIGVHHLEGHLLAAYLSDGQKPGGSAPRVPPLPHLGVLVSGGHSALVRVDAPGRYEILGTTVDDAAGEAFDKIAKAMGLPYPGGPALEALAEGGDPANFTLPRMLLGRKDCDFSFSGLKTAAARLAEGVTEPQARRDLAACVQAAIATQLAEKSDRAMQAYALDHAGQGLRHQAQLAQQPGWFVPAGGLDAHRQVALGHGFGDLHGLADRLGDAAGDQQG